MNFKDLQSSQFSGETNSRTKLRGIRDTKFSTKISKYICVAELGSGRFGAVYKGYHETTREPVAIKVESRESTIPTIKHETIMLNYLHSKSCKHIPRIHWFGPFNEKVCLVMTYYDCSLYDYITHQEGIGVSVGRSQLDTRHLLQMVLSALHAIHHSGVVHRDIKPQNIMLTRDKAVLIDFGMATFYIDETHQMIPESKTPKEHLCGTLPYISYFVHLGKSYSRRDDIISTAYLYMWMNGLLFWNIFGRNTNSDELRSPEFPRIPMASASATRPEYFANYSETHILHPKNIYIKTQKELSYIKERVRDSRIMDFIEYAYRILYDDIPVYAIS
jgi:serine/threonine protein kinase